MRAEIAAALRRLICVGLGHREVRVITGGQIDAVTAAGVAGAITASEIRCDRCGLVLDGQ